jgi:hypothetical protein
MNLHELAERELIIMEEMERRVLKFASPKAQERVKQAEIRLVEAKENLEKAKNELENARTRAEETSSPILRKQLEQTRKRANAFMKKLNMRVRFGKLKQNRN